MTLKVEKKVQKLDKRYRATFIKTFISFVFFFFVFDAYNYLANNPTVSNALFGDIAQTNSIAMIVLFGGFFLFVVWLKRWGADQK